MTSENAVVPTNPVDAAGSVEVVLIGFPGVQAFIASGRTTADLWAASSIRSDATRHVLDRLRSVLGPDDEVVLPQLPGAESLGAPNRVAIVCRAGRGPLLARAAADAADAHWSGLLHSMDPGLDAAVSGKPRCLWVCATADSYREAWAAASVGLQARKQVREFEPRFGNSPRGVCQACGSEPAVVAPKSVKSAVRDNESLCPTCLTKRHAKLLGGTRFPSTSTLATAPFVSKIVARLDEPAVASAVRSVLDAVDALQQIVSMPRLAEGLIPGLGETGGLAALVRRVEGDLWFTDTWNAAPLAREYRVNPDVVRDVSKQGRAAVSALQHLVDAPPASYYAVVVQDADRFGTELGRNPSPDVHRSLSSWLNETAASQRATLESVEHLGRVVYAGGDDLLAFCPASTALSAALAAQTAFRERFEVRELTASSAIVFAHRSAPLASVIATAREALQQAKDAGRNRVAVVVLRRGGERARVVLPWSRDGVRTLDDLHLFVTGFRAGSPTPGLWSDLCAEERTLAQIGPRHRLSEISRLCRRHAERIDAENLAVAAVRLASDDITQLTQALTVARFVAQEGR